MMESIHLQDYMRITESIKSGPLFLFFPFGLMFLHSGDTWTEDTVAVIVLAIFLLLFIPLLRWRFNQHDRKMRELYSPDYNVSANFESKAEKPISGNSGLNARWYSSIMSFEEYKDLYHKAALAAAVVFILLGGMLFFLGYLALVYGYSTAGVYFIITSLFLIVFGLVIPPFSKKHLRDSGDNDSYIMVKAPLATTDLSASWVVRKFLRENGYSYEFKENYAPQRIEKKYVLDCGNYINLVFIRIKRNPPAYTGWLQLGYKFSNYMESRKLQQELDAYLTERDILKRSQ